MDGETPTGERKRILNDFAEGKIMVLCNVELVTTGFDLSSQVGRDVPIEAVIMLRPTMSLALYLQMVGRGLRRKPQPAIILDHAGNVQRHGLPDEEREWTLKGAKKRGRGGGNAPPPPVTCENCFGQIRRPCPPVCPHCEGRLNQETRAIKQEAGDLQEVSKEDRMKARMKERANAKTLEDLILLGEQKGYKNAVVWAKHIFSARQKKQERFHMWG